MKRILLLGATGSIGLQTVDVIEQHPDQFCLVGIAAGHQVDVMQKIIDKHPTIQVAGISDVSKAKELSGVTVYSGNEAMVQCIENCEYDLLVNAVVGFRGLKPTLTSLKKELMWHWLIKKAWLRAVFWCVRHCRKQTPNYIQSIQNILPSSNPCREIVVKM